MCLSAVNYSGFRGQEKEGDIKNPNRTKHNKLQSSIFVSIVFY
jgi:hypothetical protein